MLEYIVVFILVFYFIKNKIKQNKAIDYTNKTVWITGASSGIGEYLSYAFSEVGASLILTARRQSELEKVRSKCKNPEKVDIFIMDLSKTEEIEKAVSDYLQKTNKKIDVLINNAGLSMRADSINHSLEQDLYLLKVNLISYIALTKVVLKNMIANKGGHIVAFSSIQGKLGIKNRTTYAASKHAVIGYFDSLRAEVVSHNISVSVVCPGYVKTQLNHHASYEKKIEEKDIVEKGMDPEKFSKIVLRGIFNKEKEMIIDESFIVKLAVILRNIIPDLIFKMIAKRN